MRSRTLALAIASALIVWVGVAVGRPTGAAAGPSIQRGQEIDWQRATALHQRVIRGEKLGPEDQAYYDQAKAEYNRRQGAQRQAPAVAAPRDSMGMPPLTEMGESKYKGESGGLYGGGSNQPPKAQLEAAKTAAASIKPLDSGGKPSSGGKVVLVSLGMSNTTQEFSVFKQIADSDSEKSPSLVIVDGAQGGQAAEQWLNPDDSRSPWHVLDQRLQSAGMTANQVQVVWLKQALIQQGRFGEFPAHAKKLADDVVKNLQIAKERFPNLRLAYLSSRIYGGYATGALNPEPYAYEGAYAMRWVIDRQIKGDIPKSPVILWGPYLWADGVKGRKSDSLVWKREDFGPDGTHPSSTGRQKVAYLLLRFLKSDPTAVSWFTRGQAPSH